MLKNLKVKKSLILGYAVTIVVSLLFIILLLLFNNREQKLFRTLMDTDVRANLLITDCRLQSNIAARNVREMILTDSASQRQELLTRYKEVEEIFMKNMEELKQLDPLKDGSIQAYHDTVLNWAKVVEHTIQLIQAGDLDAATAAIQNEERPAMDKMGDAARVVDNALMELQNQTFERMQSSARIVSIVIIALMVVTCAVVFAMAAKIVQNIVVPTEQVHTALLGFSEGNFDIPVDYESRNELGDMCEALRRSQETLRIVVNDECYLLGEMAEGNFNVKSGVPNAYVGGLTPVIESIRNINHRLSDTLSQINLGAEQVAAGADQVSTGAQALAQGATEQASAVEELSATVTEISNNAQGNANSSALALEHVNQAGEQLNISAQRIEEMVAAMQDVSDSSIEIGKIIATIENIAFQTNILALNAAVEAARAGSAGKGFAVVADEVRNLAAKSDEAAKATKELISSSIQSVKNGNEIVSRVTEALNKTVEAADKVQEDIQAIAKAVKEEAESVAQVTEGIDQISSVVQTNSATSEESAAASEELSGQAALMKDLMSRFTLRAETSTIPNMMSHNDDVSYSADSMAGQDDTGYAVGRSFSKY